jgi:hypothetical protein
MQPCNRIYYSIVHLWLNMFRGFNAFFIPSHKASGGPGPPHYPGCMITHTHTHTHIHTPQSVGLLWTSDQPDAETST